MKLTKLVGELPLAIHQVAYVTHAEVGLRATPSESWIEDPNSQEPVPTWGFISGNPPYMDTDYHAIVRAGLDFVMRVGAKSTAQDGDPHQIWVVSRRNR